VVAVMRSNGSFRQFKVMFRSVKQAK
jgi:hypothetical protein